MKNILLISHSSAKAGGGEEDFFRLAKFLYSDNNLYMGIPEGPRETELLSFAKSSVRVSNNIFPFYNFSFKAYLAYFKYGMSDNLKLLRFIKGKKIDVCFINSSVSFILIFSLLFKRIPVVLSIKEIIQPSFIRGIVFKLISLFTCKVIVISKFVEQLYLKQGWKKNCLLIYPSIEKDILTCNYLKVGNSENINIVNIGVITKGKGQHVLIKALKNIRNLKFEVKFIGKITDLEYYNSLLKLKKDQDHSYEFLGELTKERVFQEMKSSDIVVVTSLSEGFSFAILEALVMKLPIITSNVGIAQEVIVNGHNGFIYEQNDYKNLEDLLLKFSLNKNIFKTLGLLEDFSIRFNLDENLKRIQNVLYSCIVK